MSASSSQALEYLELLPRNVHTKLYEQPSTVLAIFKCMLPHLAKTIIMAMLYMPGPFAAADLDAWFREDSQKEKQKALSVLEQLHILVQRIDDQHQRSYSIYKSFQRSLRQALEGSGNHRSFGVPSSQPDPRKVDIAFLDQYARKQWENILFYMVGGTVGLNTSGAMGKDVNEGTKALLKMGKFVTTMGARVNITREGFTFVLQDTNAQVWSLLIVYLKNSPQLGMSETDVLSFIFMLGSLELGQDYTTHTLSATQVQLLEDLQSFGIIYRHHPDAPTFYPTRLAVTLTSSAPALSGSLATADDSALATTMPNGASNPTQKGFIIVETNYRLYAYTNSLLQIAILSMFTKLTSRFPNLVSGKLTKTSIQKAVNLGISASQIISYLTVHAHPQMQRTKDFLPPTVMDQIRLWEYEGERIEATVGYIMKDFSGDNEYKELVAYAENLGVLVWRDDSRRVFFIDRIEQMSGYLQRKAKGSRD